MWEERYRFGNPQWCPDGDPGPFPNINCMFTTEGLDVLNWGSMIIWIGYRNNPDDSVWQMVNGTELNFDHHHWGMVNTGGGNAGRKGSRKNKSNTFTLLTVDSRLKKKT